MGETMIMKITKKKITEIEKLIKKRKKSNKKTCE